MSDSVFAAFLLAPEAGVRAGPPFRRAEVYRRLVRANLRMVIANAFPVTRAILGEEGFDELVSAFYADGGPATSFFRDIPGDFVRWADTEGRAFADLLAYEWLDLLAARHPADLDAYLPAHDGRIRPNPTMYAGVYDRPVHLMGPDNRDPEPFSTKMAYLVWRRPRTDKTAFHRAGLLIANAIALAAETPATLDELARRVAADEGARGIPLEQIQGGIGDACRSLRENDGLLE